MGWFIAGAIAVFLYLRQGALVSFGALTTQAPTAIAPPTTDGVFSQFNNNNAIPSSPADDDPMLSTQNQQSLTTANAPAPWAPGNVGVCGKPPFGATSPVSAVRRALPVRVSPVAGGVTQTGVSFS